jgi:hypothetical protein
MTSFFIKPINFQYKLIFSQFCQIWYYHIFAIAFAICVSLGIHKHEKVQKIKIKNHTYKENSFCSVGIDLMKDICK